MFFNIKKLWCSVAILIQIKGCCHKVDFESINYFYRSQRSCGRVMFYTCLSFCSQEGDVCLSACWDTHTPWAGTPSGRYTPWQVHPWAGTPLGRYTTPLAGTPPWPGIPRWAGTPPGQVHPQAGTPPKQIHPWRVHPPKEMHPLQQVPPGGTPPPPRRYEFYIYFESSITVISRNLCNLSLVLFDIYILTL